MYKLAIEVGILLAAQVPNSPWGKKPFEQPYLLVERRLDENFYLSAYQTSRTNANGLTRMNPQTALWKVAAGYTEDGFTIELGHQSEHELNVADKLTESYDFLTVKYREEF